MIKQAKAAATETPSKSWKKKLAWALPMFFLIKGIMWLAIPFASAIYVLN